MKKVLVIAAAVLVLAACAKNSKVETSSAAVTDRELVNVEAPKMDYESNVSYEDQLRAKGTYIRGIKGKPSSSN